MSTKDAAGWLVQMEDTPAGSLQVQDQEAHRVTIHTASQLLWHVVGLLQNPAMHSHHAPFTLAKRHNLTAPTLGATVNP